MSSDENFKSVADELESIYREIQESGSSLDQLLPHVSRAVGLFHEFRKKTAEDSFRVFVVRTDSRGVVQEEPFDFKALS